MRVELVYMQYNISYSQALFWCSVLIILRMAGLDTLFSCSAGQQAWLCFYLALKFFTKTFLPKLLFLWNSSYQKNECNHCYLYNRSSHPEVFRKKGALKDLEKFIGKHLCWSLFFNKVARLRPATLLKKWLQHRCFRENFAQFLRSPF